MNKLFSFFMLMMVVFACKTKTIATSNSVTKSDTSSTLVKEQKVSFDSINLKPATSFDIETELDFDSNGMKPVTIKQVQGKDSVKVTLKGKKIHIKVNCSECENRFTELTHKYDSVVSIKQNLKANQSSIATKERIIKVTPWYMWLLVGSLISIIIYIKIKN